MRTAKAAIAVLVAGVFFPGTAGADVESLYDEYRNAGQIAGCVHDRGELRDALESIPTDIEAYDPGFADALNYALAQGASGCEGLPAAAAAPLLGDGTVAAADGAPGPAPVPSVEPDVASAAPPAGRASIFVLLALSAGAALAGITAVALNFGGRRRDEEP